MKRIIPFALIVFAAACSSPSEPKEEVRSEQDLLKDLHAWSNTDSLQIPEIQRAYTETLKAYLSEYPESAEHANFLFLAAKNAVTLKDFKQAAAYYADFAERYPNHAS
ncbi:MAG: hypothetical protein LPK45_06275, partial [Bacteroidota bacterium]|nr:hypothetical protein [Bacteroidota bacterium]MDX5430678.1 hypothetical protein [Bacteroidota bacterium]MDX5469425.1 hypothetical protein [Bacteroidota bacterium]